MTANALHFVSLSGKELGEVKKLSRSADADVVEVNQRTKEGEDRTAKIPHAAVVLIEAVFASRLQGGRVAELAEEVELTPNEASAILGVSRPFVVHRMDVDDLPFRYVGKQRRARLADVLALKVRLDDQRSAMRALADDAGDLARAHGV